MTAFLLQLCVAHRCSFAVLNEYRHLTQVHHRALAARAAVAVAATRLRRRRANRSPATHLQKRRKIIGCHSFTLRLQRRLDLDILAMASPQEMRRRPSVADRAPVDRLMGANGIGTRTTATPSNSLSRARQEKMSEQAGGSKDDADAEIMPPPPVRSNTNGFRAHSRSQSMATRQVNRLSLTLPIAPPTSDPSRPTPTSAAMSSVPPTPVDSIVDSPLDANDFIIAIAAQERRVLELREELLRAESDLTLLKKRWTSKDVPHKRGDSRPVGPHRGASSTSDDDSASTRQSVELDRRKSLHQNKDHTPQPSNRRRVIRGGHTRTLSLLSPAKSESGAFSLHEDGEQETVKLPPLERRTAQLLNPNLSKRASWQPRSQQAIVPGVPQLVEDLKWGFRAFVEDIRQITVGDEPITGHPNRSTAVDYSASSNRESSPGNQDTIRASQAARPKVSSVFDPPSTGVDSPTPSSKADGAPRDKAKSSKNKHFSWTPLGFDSIDDNDWSNWESPASAKNSRWSGSTIGSGGIDDTDDGDQNGTPSKKRITTDTPLLSPKLEEILPNMVNRLTPSNIKRTATILLDEWEKSLADPQDNAPGQNKENN
ncbi:hypothetical protein G7046_g6921 [Stylonectria norvegica]|nr:hypothetical protein G7046_g6921 [Stylonectria norvegica]